MRKINPALLEQMFKTQPWKFFIDDMLELQDGFRHEVVKTFIGDPDGAKMITGKIAMIDYLVTWQDQIVEDVTAEIELSRLEDKQNQEEEGD